MSQNRPSLDALRREIDRIDDAIQDLIVARTAIVERVREIKRNDPVKIRPAREAEIVQRLVARQKGPFPKRELVRIWRELIVATLSFEGPFSVAVFMPEEGSGLWDLARDQYGSFTPMTRHGSVRSVLQAVRERQATVGVLPLPRQRETDPWWRYLVTAARGSPRVIARLPVVGPGNGRGDGAEALAVSAVAPEPGGRDRTCLAFEAGHKIGLDQWSQAMAAVGLTPATLLFWKDTETPNVWLYYADVAGFIAPGDSRLEALGEAVGRPIGRQVVLGAYAEPFRADELASGSDAADGDRAAAVLAALARVAANHRDAALSDSVPAGPPAAQEPTAEKSNPSAAKPRRHAPLRKGKERRR